MISSSGVPDTSAAPARYRDRIKWTGNLSKFVASFVLSNVLAGDEVEYGIRINFTNDIQLTNSVELKVSGKYIHNYQQLTKIWSDNIIKVA